MSESIKRVALKSKHPNAKSEFLKWRTRHGINLDAAAILFDVEPYVIEDWDKLGAPTIVHRLIGVMNRDLSGFHPAWKGWKVGYDGKLYGPEKLRLAEHQLRMFPVILRQLNELEGSIHAQARRLVYEQKRIFSDMEALELLELINSEKRKLIT